MAHCVVLAFKGEKKFVLWNPMDAMMALILLVLKLVVCHEGTAHEIVRVECLLLQLLVEVGAELPRRTNWTDGSDIGRVEHALANDLEDAVKRRPRSRLDGRALLLNWNRVRMPPRRDSCRPTW